MPNQTFFCPTLSDLKALPSHLHGDVAFVANKDVLPPDPSEKGDDWGGSFVYDERLDDAPDDAIVVKPDNAGIQGRWKRRVDVRGPFHAEWFGARGDGATDDSSAINTCLEHFKRVDLLAKTYLLDCTSGPNIIRVLAGCVVAGQGIDKTTIVLKGEAITGQSIPAVQTHYSHYYAGQDNVVIRDLTIDCGFNGSAKQKTHEALDLVGGNNRVERVRAVNFGVGANGPECFVLSVKLGTSNSSPNNVLGGIRDCVVTSPGNNGDVQYPDPAKIPEITCLDMEGVSDSDLSVGGRIARNRILNCCYQKSNSNNPTGVADDQRSALHGITVARWRAIEIAENEIINFDGAAVFWMSWKDQDVLVRRNRMLNVNCGVQIGVFGSDTELADAPYHFGARIADNYIVLGRYQSIQYELRGIHLYVQPWIFTPPDPVRIKDVYIQGNFISGQTTDGKLPHGICLELWMPFFDNINIEENLVEVPDPSPSGGLQTAYENALVFIPNNQYDYSNPKVRVHHNRSIAGAELRLKIVYYTQQAAFWGPVSSRSDHFKTMILDGRSGLSYDEFLGVAPAFALGWEKDCATPGDVCSLPAYPDGYIGRPGVAKVTTGAGSANGVARLRCFREAIQLGPYGPITHVVEFCAKRSSVATAGDNYECRYGFMLNDGDAGVYFRIDATSGGTGYQMYECVCNSGGGHSQTLQSWVYEYDASQLLWRRLRIEIPVSGDQAWFFIDGRYIGKCADALVIPTALPLWVGVKVFKKTGAFERYLLLDYFQHQVY